MPKNPSPRRYRGWSVVGQRLTPEHLRSVVAWASALPSADAVAILHDRDQAETHGHVYVYDRKTPRTEAQIRRLFPVEVVVQPYTVIPDGEDAGVHEGRELARAARYLTHEHPSQAHKARYEDADVLASRGYDWRAEVDALNGREGLAALPERVTLAQLLGDVAQGLRTPRQVAEQHPEQYVRRSVGAWEALAEQAATWRAEDAREQERAQHEAEAAARAEQERARAADEAAQAEAAARAQQQEQERARATAQAEAEARQRWQASPDALPFLHERHRLEALAVLADTLELDADPSGEDLEITTARAAAEDEGRNWDGGLLDLLAAARAVDVICLDGDGDSITWDDVAEDVAEALRDLQTTAASTRAGAARAAALDVSPVGPQAAHDRLVRDVETVAAGGWAKGSEQYLARVADVVRLQAAGDHARAVAGWLAARLAELDRDERQALRDWAGLV